MKLSRAVTLGCLCLAVASPAAPQVVARAASTAAAGPSGTGMASRGGQPDRGSAPHDGGRSLLPSGPRWGGGPPPPGPFDRPVPGIWQSQAPRPGVDAFRARPDTYAPRFSSGSRGGDGPQDRRDDGPLGGRRHRQSGSFYYQPRGGVYYGASPYFYPAYPAAGYPVERPVDSARQEEPEGFLRLVITPRHASVYVDGIYEGTVDDFGGTGERALRAGLHAVRVQAEGFEPVEFDVRVPANDTITLRRDLDLRRVPVPPPPPPPTTPSAPKTIYVIPRCYLGDSRPQQNQLPAGCNVADLRTLD